MSIESKRKTAYLVDGFIILILMLPVLPLSIVNTGLGQPATFFIQLAYLLPVAFLYHTFSPFIFKNATPGMKASGLVIVDENYCVPTKKAILKRQLYSFCSPVYAFVYVKSVIAQFDLERWERNVLGTVLASADEQKKR